MSRDPFLEHARLGERSDTLITYEEIPHLPRLKRRAREYALADLAHGVMLVEKGIVAGARGARLLTGLLDILDRGIADFPWDPRVGSYLPQAERYLAARVGEDVAGRLQTGRSRNDQSAAAERIWMRDVLLEVTGDVLLLVRAVLTRAEEHADTLMPGYTHSQHAQPSTFGHTLMRHAAVLERDLQRLEGAFARTNLSAQGGAAMAGTSWPIDRARVAALLGHDGIVVNSADAGGFARDHMEEGVACLALLMNNVGRLATDLFVWHSWEFGFVEVSDALAGTSSIMPQKKNPHALERVKALAGQAIGWLPAMMGCQRTVLSTDLDYAFGDDILTPMGDACVGSLRLMTEGIATLVVHREVMAAKAGAFWSTTSHLADELVRRYDLSFRDAHQVVGRFVRDAIAAGQTPTSVDAALLVRAAREAGRPEVMLDTAEVQRALDAANFLHTRASEGSVNPRHVHEHIEQVRRAVDAHAHWHAETHRRVASALAALDGRARALAGASRR
jgi:argininosuccinate lyase